MALYIDKNNLRVILQKMFIKKKSFQIRFKCGQRGRHFYGIAKTVPNLWSRVSYYIIIL